MLNAYREGERDIAAQHDALERLITKIEGVGAVIITDMPRSPSPPTDRMTDLIAQKIELEESISTDVQEHTRQRKHITATIKKLRSADEKAVLRFRYLLGMNWVDVTNAMYGDQVDYLNKEDSYIRRVLKIHGRALMSMAKALDFIKE